MSFQSLQDEHPQLSASQLDVLHPAILSCRGVSLVGCLFILWHHYVSARLHSGVSMVQKMVVVISVLDADLAFPKVFGNPLSDTTDVTAACNVQVFALHVFGLMLVFWNAAIAHCFYRKIVHRDSETRLKSKFMPPRVTPAQKEKIVRIILTDTTYRFEGEDRTPRPSICDEEAPPTDTSGGAEQNNGTDESSVLCERPNVESPDENDFAVDVDYGDEPILLAPIVVACGSPVVVGAPTLVIDDAATVVAGGAPRSAKRIEAEIASFSTTS
ncbi:hypothetical protein JG688_00017519 [Phytophthora aleatoria]|uniref:Uncharacterized protein n=1 Tax=Phytophthora aleatoria TaxID=2496075 RepID=A0A8J5MC45_9STRA|nr:hypothetical protein JG688_00017519 [Phytophthora aleatoria]